MSVCLTLKMEGQMTRDEALAVLNVTDRRPKWLLLQVHPDKHPGREDEAAAAMKRVKQARDIMCRACHRCGAGRLS